MGLFSKKTYICKRCGKEFQTRINIGGDYCTDCYLIVADEKENIRKETKGYFDYAIKSSLNLIKEERYPEVIQHRTSIMEKYRLTNGISIAELQEASANYQNLTDDQASSILLRSVLSSVQLNIGAAYTSDFFLPAAFEKTVVDAKDVFAAAYCTDMAMSAFSADTILAVLFTNDPYIPVFCLHFTAFIDIFKFATKSKEGREGVKEILEEHCPNLTYPVQELKQLKKQIKSESVIKGNLEKKFMLDRISDASKGGSIFSPNLVGGELSESTIAMLHDYGYLIPTEVPVILKMDKKANRKFWTGQMERLHIPSDIFSP